jgi:hypothetical protein
MRKSLNRLFVFCCSATLVSQGWCCKGRGDQCKGWCSCEGATVQIEGEKRLQQTDDQGYFSLRQSWCTYYF